MFMDFHRCSSIFSDFHGLSLFMDFCRFEWIFMISMVLYVFDPRCARVPVDPGRLLSHPTTLCRASVWVRARSARLWETARLARALGEEVRGRADTPEKGVLKISTGPADFKHFGGLAENICKSSFRELTLSILGGWPRI